MKSRTRPTKPLWSAWLPGALLILCSGISDACAQPSPNPESIDRALARHVPAVFRDLRDHACKNVGVLKFRLRKGAEPAGDNVGLLNHAMATRLEIALILADEQNDPNGTVRVIRDASRVAATLPGASLETAEGRRRLFDGVYSLAWGRSQVKADTFLTGEIAVDAGLRELRVSIQAIDSPGRSLRRVVDFTCSTDLPTLVEAGEGYLDRGVFDNRKPVLLDQAKARQIANPLKDPSVPVTLELFYDDTAVPLEIRGGRVCAKEPREGQKVHFVLKARPGEKASYGVVLMVNGENSLFHERKAPRECSKWLVGPKNPIVSIKGYQTDARDAEAFRVLSKAESRARAKQFDDAGMIAFVVYRQRAANPSSPAAPPAVLDLSDDADDIAAISRAAYPAEIPEALDVLRIRLRTASKTSATRGFLAGGDRIATPARELACEFDPDPVVSSTIVYYAP